MEVDNSSTDENHHANEISDEFMQATGLEDIEALLKQSVTSRFERRIIGKPSAFITGDDPQDNDPDCHLSVYNAETDGRTIKRTEEDSEMPRDDNVSIPMALSTWKLMNNSMLPEPQVLPNDLLPDPSNMSPEAAKEASKFYMKLRGQQSEEMWIPDELKTIDAKPDFSSLESILEKSIKENAVASESGELDVPMEDIEKDIRFIQNADLDEMINPHLDIN